MPNSPSCFQIFKSLGNVLDQSVYSWTQKPGLPLDSLVPQVKKAIQRMSCEYRSGNRPEIPFDNPLYRSAYLYEYAPANALAVEAVLNYDAQNQRLVSGLLTSKQRISLCCLGGGPGSEILGIAKWIERRRVGQIILDVLVTDKYREWDHEWKSLVRAVNSNRVQSLRSLPTITGRFAQVDVEEPSDASDFGCGSGFDLYIVSYVVSHIFTSEGLSRFGQFIAPVLSAAPKGAKFLFIDRGGVANEAGGVNWHKSVRDLLSCTGMDISDPVPLFSNSPGDSREKKTDLGVLYEHLDIDPRLGWDIFWMVGTKV